MRACASMFGCVFTGFRLATFRVRSDTGTEYEYAIQNKNELLAPFKIEKFEQQREKVNALKAAENRSAQNSSNWKQDPTSRDKTVAVYAEIVSARGFSGGRLHVAYEVLLPPNWLLRTGDLSDGVGKRSSTMTQPAAVVAVPLVEYPAAGASSSTAADGTMKRTASLEELVSRAANSYEDTAGEGMLQGCTQSAILNDSDGIRTAFTLPFVRPRWAGLYLSHAAMKITRLIVGSAFFIASVMAVVLGIGYPFWIVPALGILFVLGTGMPGGPPQAVLRKSHRDSTSSTISRQKENRIAKRVTYSKIVPQQCEVVGETITEPCAVFNHLLSFSFDVKDATAEEYSLLAPSAHQPTIFFQVYSTDYFGRQRLEGYGYHHFSDAAGSVDAEVSTWKPMGTIRDQMNEFFLGNSLRLRDESYVETVNKAAKALNRFGMKTQSAGCVRIRTQSILTDPRLVEQQRLQQAEVLQQQQMSTAKVKRTVDDILKSFRLSASAANTPRVGGIATSAGGRIAGLMTPRKTAEFSPAAGKPSPNQILSTLNETAKANKVADILARARAKTGQQKGAKDSTAIPPTASASKSATAGSSSSNIGELPPMKKLALGQLKRPNSDAAQPPLSSRRDVSSGSSSFDRDNPYDPHIDRPAHDRKQPIVTPRSGRASATGTPRVLEPLPEGRTFSSTRAHSPGESPSGSSESPSFSTPSYSPHAPLHNAQQPQNGRAARRYDVGADSPSGDDSDAQQLEEEQRGAPQSARGGAGADSGTDTGEEDAPLLRRDS